jgi:hypothetical protein
MAMIIEQAGHYIVTINSNAGVQYAHVELPAGYDTASHPAIREIKSGPHPDAPTAWQEHRRKLTSNG